MRVGGCGHPLGDEGSGYWAGQEATKAALESCAGASPSPTLEACSMRPFGTDDDREVLREVYSGSFSEEAVAH